MGRKYLSVIDAQTKKSLCRFQLPLVPPIPIPGVPTLPPIPPFPPPLPDIPLYCPFDDAPEEVPR